MAVKKVMLFIVLAAMAALLLVVSPIALAQNATETRYVVNMTGVGESRLVVNRDGVGDSRFVVSTVVIEIGLRGLVVYPVSVNFGLLRANDIRATDYDFAIYNAGTTVLNVTIGVTGDWIGATGNWIHSDECEVGESTAGLRAIVEDGGDDHTSIVVRKTEPYNYLTTNLQPDETVSFALEIYAPTALEDYSRKANGIFVAIEE
jgi:hypothetical protein